MMSLPRMVRKSKNISSPTFPSYHELNAGVDTISVGEYVRSLESQFNITSKTSHSVTDAIMKGLAAPPQEFSYSRISSMPSTFSEGVIQWPDLSPQAYRKVVQTNLTPQMIIGNRVDDVLAYASPSTHPYMPGWRILPRDGSTEMGDATKREIRDAERFLLQCNSETGWDARKRDTAGYQGWTTFLSSIIRDSLTYDAIAIFTDMDQKDRVKGFKALSAGNISLTGKDGYKGKKDIFAVGQDEAGNVCAEFTRDQLIWYVRNPRTDPTISGYGYSEIFMSIKLIGGLTNALDLNLSVFDRNAIPNGMLLLKGLGWTQRQLDILARLWTDLKQGATKAWALPAVAIPEGAEIDMLDLSSFRNDMTIYYADFMNFATAVFCMIYRFPYQRLGYRSSGVGKGTEMPNLSNPSPTNDVDVGKGPLLGHVETIVNEYLLWTRWPDLQFHFTGKNPNEEEREYLFRCTSMTLSEKRMSCGLPPLEKTVSKKYKELAILMGLAPVDPSLSGIFQNIASAYLGNESEGSPEREYNSQVDPAKGLEHGHNADPRDSRAEKESAEINAPEE